LDGPPSSKKSFFLTYFFLNYNGGNKFNGKLEMDVTNLSRRMAKTIFPQTATVFYFLFQTTKETKTIQ